MLAMLWNAKLDESLLRSELQQLFISGSPQPKDKDSPLCAIIRKTIDQIMPSIATILPDCLLCPLRSSSAPPADCPPAAASRRDSRHACEASPLCSAFP
jgi:hypothetical protein